MRFTRVVVAAILLWGMQTGVGFAYYDDGWIEKLSGPGPFRRVAFPLRFLCVASSSAPMTGTPLTAASGDPVFVRMFPTEEFKGARIRTVDPSVAAAERPRATAEVNCLNDQNVYAFWTLDVGGGWSLDNTLFDDRGENAATRREHRVKFLDFGVSFNARVHRMVDLSTGVGLSHFFGDSFESFDRAWITPFKVTFAPFAVRDSIGYRVFQVYIGSRLYLKGFDDSDFCQADFGCSGALPYENPKEIQWTVGVKVDPVAFFRVW